MTELSRQKVINAIACWLLMPLLIPFAQHARALPAYLSPVHSTMRLGLQQRLTTLFPTSFGLETNSALAPLYHQHIMSVTSCDYAEDQPPDMLVMQLVSQLCYTSLHRTK